MFGQQKQLKIYIKGLNNMEANERDDNLFADERKEYIVEYVNLNKKTTVTKLCEHFSVSPATIRNDLRELETNGRLKRTHGGAMANIKTTFELQSNQKVVKDMSQKLAIAKIAADYVADGDSVCIDTGTTTFEFAKLLVDKKDLIVVTNDIYIAAFFEKKTNFKIMLTGGMVRNGFGCLTGSNAIDSIKDLRVDKSFMSTNGFSTTRGASTPNLEMSEIKRHMLMIADEKIMLCTSSKLGRASFSKFADISDFDSLITDTGIPDLIRKEFEDVGIEVEIAEVQE